MAELKETCINWVAGEDFYSLSSGIVKDINAIKKAKEKFPDLVTIEKIYEDGYIIAKFSKKLQPPVYKKPRTGRVYTEEEKKANGERLREYRKKKMEDKLNE